jgi:sarcosine oxidase delta subunit
MYKINPCPMCGSSVELDSTCESEYHGYAYQNKYIRCLDLFDAHCDMEMSITADFMFISNNTDELLVELWNKLLPNSK